MSLSNIGSFFVQLPQKKTSFFYIHSLCFLLPCPIPHVIIRPHHSRLSGDGYIFFPDAQNLPQVGAEISEKIIFLRVIVSAIAFVLFIVFYYLSCYNSEMGTVMAVQTEVEKLADIEKLRPIDDLFFEVLAGNKEICEEILRTIDALCMLGNGVKCNIEVQRADNDNHLRRARFNASSITVKYSHTGDHFEDVIELYVIYISDFDFLNKGKTIYHVEKVLRETNTVIDDGLHEIYVNTTINDHSDVAELMTCFKQKMVDNPKFPRLSAEVQRLKNTEGGISTVCKIMEESNKRAIKDVLFGLVEKGALSSEIAANELSISVDELLSEMQHYGYAVPQKTA